MKDLKKILVTGGAGFIGVNLIKLILRDYPDYHVINFDALTYAGNLVSLADVENNPRYTFIKGDVANREAVNNAIEGCWGVLHLAAESHVDRSILDAAPFLNTNVIGTMTILDAMRKHNLKRYVQVSTDEVYGALKPDDPEFSETNRLLPNSPYSASKAGADLLVRSYFKTYDLPVIITRCSNNYGPYQFPEKLIPLLISNALQDKPIPVYGDGCQIRDWLYVEDHCRALMTVFEKGMPGEIYNIGGNNEIMNLDLVKTLLRQIGKPESLIESVKDRPGHDRRYAINSSRIKNELGWEPQYKLEDAMQKTVAWYLENDDWIDSVISGDYMEYYNKQYGE
ncbi:dTDP-glucose 4,6-dehydratase [bacterium]|nr:dTDP-glucose 4,6-dehydratase [bacterium]